MTFNRARKLGGLSPGLSDAGAIQLERTRGADLYRGDQGGLFRGVRARNARARMLDGAEVGVAFSPDQIEGLEIWLDASDASTVTTVDDAGTPRVSAWASKAGASRSFTQSVVANRPEYVNEGYFLFNDARGDHLTFAETSGLDWSDGTVVAVVNVSDTASLKEIFNISEFTTGYRLEFLLSASEGIRLAIQATVSGGDVQNGSGPSGVTTTNIAHWEDGVSITVINDDGTTTTDLTYSTPILTYDLLNIGRRRNGSRFFSGRMMEFLFWPTRLSSAQIDAIFSYTDQKWGN